MAVSALSTFYWEPKQFWEPDLDHRKQFLIQKTSIALQAIGLVGINSTLFLTAPIYIIPILCTSTAYGILGTIGAIACPLLMKGSLFQNIYPTNSWLSESQTLRVVRCVHNFFSVAGVFLAHALTLSAIRLYPWPGPALPVVLGIIVTAGSLLWACFTYTNFSNLSHNIEKI